MSDLEYAFKFPELKTMMKEQANGRFKRAAITIPFEEDKVEQRAQDSLYEPYCESHGRRGELGFANITTKRKIDGEIIPVKYRARVVGAYKIEDEKNGQLGYRIELRFADCDLIW